MFPAQIQFNTFCKMWKCHLHYLFTSEIYNWTLGWNYLTDASGQTLFQGTVPGPHTCSYHAYCTSTTYPEVSTLRYMYAYLQMIVSCMVPYVGGGGGSGLKSAFNLQRHNAHCKLDSVVYVAVCGCRHGELNWTCLIGLNNLCSAVLVCQTTTQFCLGWAERNHSGYYTDSEMPSQLPNSLLPSAKLWSANLQVFCLWCGVIRDQTMASRTLSRITRLQGGPLHMLRAGLLWLGQGSCIGITIASTFQWENRIIGLIAKANRTLGFLCLNLNTYFPVTTPTSILSFTFQEYGTVTRLTTITKILRGHSISDALDPLPIPVEQQNLAQ